jgi:carbonic anhydrase
MKQVQEKSAIIHDQIAKQQIMLVGAMQDLKTGQVTFFDEHEKKIS